MREREFTGGIFSAIYNVYKHMNYIMVLIRHVLMNSGVF